jgi:ABC-type multidrug transport system fused ATPase/permease subunit
VLNTSFRQNILYGRIGSDEDQMIEAARAACIHDKILSFPERYDTKVRVQLFPTLEYYPSLPLVAE